MKPPGKRWKPPAGAPACVRRLAAAQERLLAAERDVAKAHELSKGTVAERQAIADALADVLRAEGAVIKILARWVKQTAARQGAKTALP